MCIVHKGFRGFRAVSPASIFGGNLIGFKPAIPYDTIHLTLTIMQDRERYFKQIKINYMKLKNFILFGLLFSFGLLYAQTDFRPGYIINMTVDTLYGDIDYRGDLLMSGLCKFRDNDNTIKDYSPNDIIAYRFIDSKYYVSREINNRRVFLEYLIKGKVNIYYMRDENGDHYYLDKEDVKLTEIPYEEGIKYVDDKQVFYESKKHIGLLNYYMQDAPEFQSRIQSLKKPEHQNLIKLAEDYHNAVCEGEKCIIYEKKQPFLKVNLEGVAGVVKFKNIDDVIDKYYFQSGVIIHFWMPRTNEKIYFKTGFLYSQPEQDGEKKTHIKVPTHIGYLAPNTYRIRPSVSIGLLSPSYSGGVAVKINKRINLGVQSWVNFDFDKAPWIPSQLFNYSILGNLYIEL